MHPTRLLAVGVFTSAVVAALTAVGHTLAPSQIEVEGLDYAFRAPAQLPPGRTVFRFVNRGKVRHELNIVLLAPGVSVAQLVKIADPDKPRDPATVTMLTRMIEATVGVVLAEPGEHTSAALVTDLLPGRTYVIRCVARDKPGAPAHHTLGMYTALHVTTAPAAAPGSPVRADTVTAVDYSFRYPRTLSPGLHTFAFVNAGRQRHMAYLALLRRGVTVERLTDRAKAGQDPRSVLEHSEGVLHSFAGTRQPQGFLQVRLLPGRDYVLLCFISDIATAPPHFMFGMSGTIHVTQR